MPTKFSPELSAAGRFEVLADDLVRRIEAQELTMPGSITADVLEACARLKRAIESHEVAVAQPINDQLRWLTDKQGDMIRAFEVERDQEKRRLADACATIAEFADEQAEWQRRAAEARAQGAAEGERSLIDRAIRLAESEETRRFLEGLRPKGITPPGKNRMAPPSDPSMPF